MADYELRGMTMDSEANLGYNCPARPYCKRFQGNSWGSCITIRCTVPVADDFLEKQRQEGV